MQRRGLSLPLERLFTPVESSLEATAAARATLLAMQVGAARRALDEAGVDAAEVGWLIYGDVSGYGGFGHVGALGAALGLSASAAVLSVDHIGCIAGFRLLSLAAQLSRGSRRPALLVYGDLAAASHHVLPDELGLEDVVSLSLFADGAGAAVVGAPRDGASGLYEVLSSASAIVPGSSREMRIAASLAPQFSLQEVVTPKVAVHISKNVSAFAHRLLDSDECMAAAGARLDSVPLLVHPGGKTILEAVQRRLGAGREQLASSWAVMREHGNMAGATNLAVLDHHRREGAGRPGSDICLALSFGPGLSMEGLLLRALPAQPRGPATPPAIYESAAPPRPAASSPSGSSSRQALVPRFAGALGEE